MTIFRPCIDLHSGQVKQIVGGTLDENAPGSLKTNFVSPHPPAHFARLYRDNGLRGAHVIMLGPGNADAAREALAAWPGGLQVGGGITDQNAREWIDAGAEKVSNNCVGWMYLHQGVSKSGREREGGREGGRKAREGGWDNMDGAYGRVQSDTASDDRVRLIP